MIYPKFLLFIGKKYCPSAEITRFYVFKLEPTPLKNCTPVKRHSCVEMEHSQRNDQRAD